VVSRYLRKEATTAFPGAGIDFAIQARMLTNVVSASVLGIEAETIDIEVNVGRGLPGTHIVGLPDAGVKEGRVRIREAIEASGFRLTPQKIVINLAPADVKKDGAVFDLPIAAGILSSCGVVPTESLSGAALVGELALDGRVRPVRGVLPIAAWAGRTGVRRLFVPERNAAEAVMAAGDCEVIPVATLGGLVARLRGEGEGEAGTPSALDTSSAENLPDLLDVRGQNVARRSLEIAAAGGHNLAFVGPPGSGKTLLAHRLPGILPTLSFQESLETTMIFSVAGLLGREGLVRNRPFRAPHHTISMAGLVGGGALVRPGEISLAHNGVLFLDELLEFPRTVLETLRQPLEDRQVTIVRARRAVRFPASFMLVAALNPCPCGHLGNPHKTCTCSATAIANYRARLSGPLIDRIDMHVDVPALAYRDLAAGEPGEASATVRQRVELARARQVHRSGKSNARMSSAELESCAVLDDGAHRLLERAVSRFALSARAVARVRRVARTIADLAGSERVAVGHLGEALQYRALDREVA